MNPDRFKGKSSRLKLKVNSDFRSTGRAKGDGSWKWFWDMFNIRFQSIDSGYVESVIHLFRLTFSGLQTNWDHVEKAETSIRAPGSGQNFLFSPVTSALLTDNWPEKDSQNINELFHVIHVTMNTLQSHISIISCHCRDSEYSKDVQVRGGYSYAWRCEKRSTELCEGKLKMEVRECKKIESFHFDPTSALLELFLCKFLVNFTFDAKNRVKVSTNYPAQPLPSPYFPTALLI